MKSNKKSIFNKPPKEWFQILQQEWRESEPIAKFFAIFAIVFYLLFYFINWILYQNRLIVQYDNLLLRLFISILSLGLFLKDYWPKRWHYILPFYWHICLIIFFPFFITFMTLKNNMSGPWVLNAIVVYILMALVSNWIIYLVLLAMGIILAWASFSLTAQEFVFSPTPVSQIDIFNAAITGIVMACILSRKRKFQHRNELLVEKSRTDSMRLLGASIAHELRTPLHSVKLFIHGVEEYLPSLVSVYQMAKRKKLIKSIISDAHLDLLARNINNINLNVDHANLVIDMLMVNLSFKKIASSQFKLISITECVNTSLVTYPLSNEEKQLITCDLSQDFKIKGSKVLIVQVLFNLIKNALYAIKEVNQGDIFIWSEEGKTANKLFFRDTGKGISADVLPYIFDKFFTKGTSHGTGIGLAFCKMALNAQGASIYCSSKKGLYTLFVLNFPVVSVECKDL